MISIKTLITMKGKTIALLAIGAAVVLLFTTDKGKKIREDITDKADDWGDKLGDLSAKGMDQFQEMRQKLMDEFEGLASDVRKRVSTMLDDAKEKKDKVKEKVTDIGKEQLS